MPRRGGQSASHHSGGRNGGAHSGRRGKQATPRRGKGQAQRPSWLTGDPVIDGQLSAERERTRGTKGAIPIPRHDGHTPPPNAPVPQAPKPPPHPKGGK